MRRIILAILLFFLGGLTNSGAMTLQVAVSIKPLHSLVSSLMQGVAEPVLVISSSGSPHGYNLRPSEVRLLHKGDLVIWVGPEFESFMNKVVTSKPYQQSILTLIKDAPDLTILASREGGQWTDLHGHKIHEDDHTQTDPHIWLSPSNAIVIASAVAKRLAQIDPEHADLYKKNLTILTTRLKDLDNRLNIRVTALQGMRYFVFHDAYQYFENHFDLKPLGALAIDPNRRPGARRLTEIKDQIRKASVQCIFSEPQFEPRLVQVLTEDTSLRTGTLDPLGVGLEPGPELYFSLMEQMAAAMETCLSGRE